MWSGRIFFSEQRPVQHSSELAEACKDLLHRHFVKRDYNNPVCSSQMWTVKYLRKSQRSVTFKRYDLPRLVKDDSMYVSTIVSSSSSITSMHVTLNVSYTDHFAAKWARKSQRRRRQRSSISVWWTSPATIVGTRRWRPSLARVADNRRPSEWPTLDGNGIFIGYLGMILVSHS